MTEVFEVFADSPTQVAMEGMIADLQALEALPGMGVFKDRMIGHVDMLEEDYPVGGLELLRKIEGVASLYLLDQEGRAQHWEYMTHQGYPVQVLGVDAEDYDVYGIITPVGQVLFG